MASLGPIENIKNLVVSIHYQKTFQIFLSKNCPRVDRALEALRQEAQTFKHYQTDQKEPITAKMIDLKHRIVLTYLIRGTITQ